MKISWNARVLLAALIVAAAPSPSPLPTSPLQALAQCISAVGPPPTAVARTFPSGTETVSNLCSMTINLTSCYADGTPCAEHGLPPMRQETLPSMTVISGHGGIHFHPCQGGFDAVDARGHRIARYVVDYHCVAEARDAPTPPCAVPDGPAIVIVAARPTYPSGAEDAGPGEGEVTVLVSRWA